MQKFLKKLFEFGVKIVYKFSTEMASPLVGLISVFCLVTSEDLGPLT